MSVFRRFCSSIVSLFFCLSFVLCLSSVAFGAGEGLDLMTNVPNLPSPEMAGVRPMGMGNAGLALADGPEGFTLNPAGLSRYNGSFFEAGFYFHPSADYRVFNASIADAKTNPLIAGGMSYSFYTAPRESDGKASTIEGHIVRLATAFRWSKTFYLGTTVKYVHLTRPFYTTLSVPQIDLGFTWQVIPLLSVSLVGYNLIWNDSGETPISMGLGIAFGYQYPLRVTVDWVIDFQSRHNYLKHTDPSFDKDGPLQVGHEFRAGLEYVIANIVSIRAGYQFDQVRGDRHYLGVGIGFKYKFIGAEIAYRQQLAAEREGDNRTFAFTARFFF
jgi:hypothetical protein